MVGIADTWTPAASDAPGGEAPLAEAVPPVAEPADRTADTGQPAPADGKAEDQQAEAGSEPGPDRAVTVEGLP
jgi:hypothetical protein